MVNTGRIRTVFKWKRAKAEFTNFQKKILWLSPHPKRRAQERKKPYSAEMIKINTIRTWMAKPKLNKNRYRTSSKNSYTHAALSDMARPRQFALLYAQVLQCIEHIHGRSRYSAIYTYRSCIPGDGTPFISVWRQLLSCSSEFSVISTSLSSTDQSKNPAPSEYQLKNYMIGRISECYIERFFSPQV